MSIYISGGFVEGEIGGLGLGLSDFNLMGVKGEGSVVMVIRRWVLVCGHLCLMMEVRGLVGDRGVGRVYESGVISGGEGLYV